jgi:hypothetical protein
MERRGRTGSLTPRIGGRIAKAVGISDKAMNMDSRASAVSEAAEAGVSDDDIILQTGHGAKEILQKTYKRGGVKASQRSHEKRQKLRVEEELAGQRAED